MKLLPTLVTALCVAPALPALAQDEPVPLISREVIFGNPTRVSPRISPDGTHLSFLAPVDGVLNLWVGQVGRLDRAQPVTRDKTRGVRVYHWAYTSEHLLYLRDQTGQGHWRLYCVDLITGQENALTPDTATGLGRDRAHHVSASIVHLSPRFPQDVLVSVNDRDPRFPDLYRLNIVSGQKVGVLVNEEFEEFFADDDYNVRFASRPMPEGGRQLLVRTLPRDGEERWEPFAELPIEDIYTTGIVGFDRTGAEVYMLDSRGSDTAVLKSVELAANSSKVLAKDRNADISGGILIHPVDHTIQAAAATYQRKKWYVLDDSVRKDFKYLERLVEGDLEVISRTLDDKQWVVGYDVDRGPASYYLYDREAGQAAPLFVNRSGLEGQSLAAMYTDLVKTRDKYKMVAYYTLPVGADRRGNGKPAEPLPTVLWVHGGPWWSREYWGYNPVHQWLANRGYAVLSVNYRGSAGFGKKYMEAAQGEWGGRMHDDLLDAVQWAVEKKISDPKRIAIMGGSYGGYAALVGLTRDPEAFACGVDIVGPADLAAFLESVPAWAPLENLWASRVGEYRTDEGRALLAERSPVNHADRIVRPLLVAQGANDQRARKSDTDRIVASLKKNGVPVTYVVYGDEGHGLTRLENRISFFAVAEQFLAEHLGGRVEPIGDDLEGSTAKIVEGGPNLAGVIPK